MNYQELFSIYHGFQLAMEVVADLSSMMVKDLANIAQDDYSNYKILHEKKLLSTNVYSEIKELNGLRNRVVHDYNGINDKIALSGIIESLDILPKFKMEVKTWLNQQ